MAERSASSVPPAPSRARESDWPSVLFFIHVHLLATYGLWLLLFEAKLLTVLLFVSLTLLGTLGVTSGAHRLWAHRSYTASTTLRVLLMLCQTLVGQGPIYDWVRLHRLHHEHFGTDGDPYNYNKGFAFAQVFTHLQALSPYQEKLLKGIDMSDMDSDRVVMFQKRFYYWLLYPVVFLLLPINAPVEYWGDTVLNSIFIMLFLRYGMVLHAAWLVNSAICIWGLKPGDKYPADTNMVFILTKSYWPNYHYLLPNDYKSGEYGTYGHGCSTTMIRVWAALGWATQLRTMEPAAVRRALADAARRALPVPECLAAAEAAQRLPDDHFMIHDS